MKVLESFAGLVTCIFGVLFCGVFAFIVGYVVIVGLTIPQLPVWAQHDVEQWMLDVPQDSEQIDDDSIISDEPGGNPQSNNGGKEREGGGGGGNGENNESNNGGSGAVLPAGGGTWTGYVGPYGDPQGFPLIGPVEKWSVWYDAPLRGCEFQDPKYKKHIGFDSPVNVGTPVYSTMGGRVVWAQNTEGGWGNLVIIENGDTQIYLAHLSQIDVQPGDIVEPGQQIGLSGGDPSDPNAGKSTGPHLHYGIKKRTAEGGYVWIDPETTFDAGQLTPWGCSKK